MTKERLSFDDVRTIGLTLPDVVEATSYGAPALKLRGQVLASVPVNKSAEPNSVVIRIGQTERAELIAAWPGLYYVTEHYQDYPTMLIRLSKVTRGQLSEALQAA